MLSSRNLGKYAKMTRGSVGGERCLIPLGSQTDPSSRKSMGNPWTSIEYGGSFDPRSPAEPSNCFIQGSPLRCPRARFAGSALRGSANGRTEATPSYPEEAQLGSGDVGCMTCWWCLKGSNMKQLPRVQPGQMRRDLRSFSPPSPKEVVQSSLPPYL